MTLGARIAWDDTVLPFQLDRPDIRGRVARLDQSLERILAQHRYPRVIEDLVAEAAMLTVLIGQTIKLRWRLSLQIRGNGPARLIATDYFAPAKDGAPGRIRAYASFDSSRLDPDAPGFEQIGQGYFAVLIDQGRGTTPYQGITPIAGDSLGDCAQSYFTQSEQLPTRFVMRFDSAGSGRRGGGMMLQHMPRAGVHVTGGSADSGSAPDAADILGGGEGAENWARVNMLLDTVATPELVGPSVQAPELLVRLFHAETPRVYDPQPVQFGCTCTEAKVRQSLSIYSAKDIASMTTPEGTVTADCQFCGAHYAMDPNSLGFEATPRAAAGAGDDGRARH